MDKRQELAALQAELADLKQMAGESNSSMPEISAEGTAPTDMIKKLAPSNVLPAVGVAATNLAKETGVDVTTIVNPLIDAGKAVDAVKNPMKTVKGIGNSLKRGAQALTDENFKPTEDEKTPMQMGKWAGIAMEVAAAPGAKIAKGGKIDRASETLDSLAGVPRGSSRALLREPSKWTKIFASKAGVKAAYKKAVDAGEMVADDVSTKGFDELLGEATSGSVKTIKDLAKEVKPIMGIDPEKAKTFENIGALKTQKLTAFRKALNDEIGRLKSVLEKGIENEKVNNVAVRRLVGYQELARRTNKILDKVAPKFREADKLMEASKEMAPFRSGFKPLAMGSTIALAGVGLKVGSKVPAAGDALANALTRMRNKRKEGRK